MYIEEEDEEEEDYYLKHLRAPLQEFIRYSLSFQK